MNRKALGKGINALIPDFEIGVPQSGGQGSGPGEILIDDIVPNRLQPRKFFDDEKLQELVFSIQEKGVLQPVIVQKGKGNQYELIVGERRWRASKKAGLKKIPAIIREVSDAESLEIAIIENIHRHDLNPIEEAEAYSQLANEFGLTQEKLAQKVGKKRTTITNTIRLLKLPNGVKEDMVSGRFSMGHARALLGLETAKDIEVLRREILKKDMNVRQAEERVRQLKKTISESTTKPKKKKDIFLKNLETALERHFGTKVEIAAKQKGGKITLTYYSDDDLERIRSLMMKNIG
ncbi:Chromosome (plasmid) partitioning protein ParB [hydrothermal vent metagenome]|uniref:Chromosome (Plasmid) partitioning protein ParB n=1 Tax=hydrothermal vent metagenome TaxID=652676 RepID=A0A3B1CM99_9ZZZZ